MTALLGTPTRHNRLIVGTGLTTVTVISWIYLFFLAAQMTAMGSPFAMPMSSSWTGRDLALMWTMWAVMMAAMMIPSAVLMVSAYSTTINAPNAKLHGSTPLFVVGYLAAWSGFAAIATVAQWLLHDAALVDAMGASKNAIFGGIVLVGAGGYQFTSMKQACLTKCKTPLGFLLNEWREGARGAAVMGLRHGTFCIGCCWALMSMLFVLGVMNLWWIAVVAAIVLLEKLVPSTTLTRLLGGALLIWGLALIGGIGS